jgi:hypothetical protein
MTCINTRMLQISGNNLKDGNYNQLATRWLHRVHSTPATSPRQPIDTPPAAWLVTSMGLTLRLLPMLSYTSTPPIQMSLHHSASSSQLTGGTLTRMFTRNARQCPAPFRALQNILRKGDHCQVIERPLQMRQRTGSAAPATSATAATAVVTVPAPTQILI